MKKFSFSLFTAIAVLFLYTTTFAYNGPEHKKPTPENDSLLIFNKHKIIFYLGYGLGVLNNNYITPDGFQINGSTQVGPVYFKVEKALYPKISIGLNTYFQYDHWSSSFEDFKPNIPISYTRTYKRLSYGALVRLNYHAKVSRKFDTFIGGGIGYKNENWTRTTNLSYPYNDEPPTISHFAYEATGGVRYLLGPHWLAYVEAGYSKSIFQTGISFNIPKP